MILRMPRQLDILALEPYHGGARRAMLDALSRCSRHRWTLLKLPARRFERRQLVAATWFAEHLSRNEIGNVDVVFSSEALTSPTSSASSPTWPPSPRSSTSTTTSSPTH
jgi:hypothetical protein